MEQILTVNGLSKKYGSVTAVSDLSFSIEKGKVYGILGPNGSGKSTTLGMVLNVVNPTGGGFSWFEGRLTTHQALKRVGAIIERPNFYPYMSAAENLRLVCKIKEVPESGIEKRLDQVGLLARKHGKFRTFSLGMKQRLAIASALLNDPDILILDEPTNGLDPEGIHQIREIIKEIAGQGTTILLASHLLDEVEKVCSHVVVLVQGIKRFSGPVDGMTAGHGFFELVSVQNEALMAFLSKTGYFGSTRIENGVVLAYPDRQLDPSELNRMLFENGLVLSHLVKRRESLEERFLALTRKRPNT